MKSVTINISYEIDSFGNELRCLSYNIHEYSREKET